MPECEILVHVRGRDPVADAMRKELAALRKAGESFDARQFFAALEARLGAAEGVRRVLNATGVVLHTNLGRAPLAGPAIAAMTEVARGYCSLEMDLESGRRGDRFGGATALLRELTGCETALVVNNGAAAVLLALSAVASGGEAIVSRGELVEIGGGFRIPEVVAQGGARLVEVGTTNRTRLPDYEHAIGPDARVILRVHPSNYRILGFTEAPEPARLAALARERGLVSVEDLGSGALLDLARVGLPGERGLRQAVADGFDLVAASGDKLLGGPQAGLLLGREDAIARCARHPLMRALRPDKATLAALEATLRLHRDPELALREVPALRMMAEGAESLSRRAQTLLTLLPEAARAEAVAGDSLVGGGALPLARLPTTLVALHPENMTAEELAARLRRSRPPLVARLERGRLLLDPRTLAEGEIGDAARAVAEALA